MSAPSRRAVIGGAGLAGLSGLALAGCGRSGEGDAKAANGDPPGVAVTARAREFHGARQHGIADAPQAHAVWVAFSLPKAVRRDDVRRLLTVWSDGIARLTAGSGTLTDQEPELAEMVHRLTVTVAVGPGFFERIGASAKAPSWLKPLPRFDQIDGRLDDRWAGTDLCLQIAAESAATVSHTQRQLITAAGRLAKVEWVQRGFREPVAQPHWGSMRNLFGQKDGTVNPVVDGEDDAVIWAGDDAGWFAGGSAMVIRRIVMDMDSWDRADRYSRENAMGRRLDNGAPLTGGDEMTPPDLLAKDDLGFPVIDNGAHMRRAMPRAPHERFLRRPYSYDDSTDPDGTGLVFVAFCADPVRQFVPVQRRLAQADLLNLWTYPIGSAVYAVLPGAADGEYLGQSLFA